MENQNIILQQLSVPELRNIISESIREQLEGYKTKQSETDTLPELLTRKQTATYLRITLVTLHNWCKSGRLQSYQIAGRIRFKREEIVNAIQQVKNLKYRRD